MENEMYQKIMEQAQQYGQQYAAGLAPVPTAPVISQDISQLQGINDTLSQGDRLSAMASGYSQKDKNDYAWAEEMKKRAAAAQEEKLKPRKVPKADGGFDFFIGDKPISAYEYARATGTDIVSVLNDSMNPDDLRLLNDYDKLRTFWASAQELENMGSVNIDKFKVDDGVLVDEKGDEIGEDDPRFVYYSYIQANPEMRNMSLDQTRKKFMKRYSRAFINPGEKI